jgi:hypothetical protein
MMIYTLKFPIDLLELSLKTQNHGALERKLLETILKLRKDGKEVDAVSIFQECKCQETLAAYMYLANKHDDMFYSDQSRGSS